jgi:hypothetical protein
VSLFDLKYRYTFEDAMLCYESFIISDIRDMQVESIKEQQKIQASKIRNFQS